MLFLQVANSSMCMICRWLYYQEKPLDKLGKLDCWLEKPVQARKLATVKKNLFDISRKLKRWLLSRKASSANHESIEGYRHDTVKKNLWHIAKIEALSSLLPRKATNCESWSVGYHCVNRNLWQIAQIEALAIAKRSLFDKSRRLKCWLPSIKTSSKDFKSWSVGHR